MTRESQLSSKSGIEAPVRKIRVSQIPVHWNACLEWICLVCPCAAMSNLLLYPQRCDGQNMDTPASLECLSSVSMYISACVSFQTHQDVLRMPVVVCAGAVLTLERVALITRQQQQHDMTQGIYLAEWLSTHGSSIGRTFLQGTPPTTSLPERIDAIYIYSHTLTCMELRAREHSVTLARYQHHTASISCTVSRLEPSRAVTRRPSGHCAVPLYTHPGGEQEFVSVLEQTALTMPRLQNNHT